MLDIRGGTVPPDPEPTNASLDAAASERTTMVVVSTNCFLSLRHKARCATDGVRVWPEALRDRRALPDTRGIRANTTAARVAHALGGATRLHDRSARARQSLLTHNAPIRLINTSGRAAAP